MSAVQIEAVVCGKAPTPQCTRSGVWFLRFDARPHPATITTQADRLPPFSVRKEFGSGPSAAQVCRTRANQLQPGVRVRVAASGVITGRIVLQGSDLQLPDLYDHHQKVSP